VPAPTRRGSNLRRSSTGPRAAVAILPRGCGGASDFSSHYTESAVRPLTLLGAQWTSDLSQEAKLPPPVFLFIYTHVQRGADCPDYHSTFQRGLVRLYHAATPMVSNGYMRSCAGRGAKAVESVNFTRGSHPGRPWWNQSASCSVRRHEDS